MLRRMHSNSQGVARYRGGSTDEVDCSPARFPHHAAALLPKDAAVAFDWRAYAPLFHGSHSLFGHRIALAHDGRSLVGVRWTSTSSFSHYARSLISVHVRVACAARRMTAELHRVQLADLAVAGISGTVPDLQISGRTVQPRGVCTKMAQTEPLTVLPPGLRT